MPADLLTIAFALTLVVNALFVFVAIRALRLGRFDAAGPARERDTARPPSPPAVTRAIRPDPPDVVRAVAARRAALADPESTPWPPVRSAPAQNSAPTTPSSAPTAAEAARTPGAAMPAVEPDAGETVAIHMTPLAERLLAELEAARAARDPDEADVDVALSPSRRPNASEAPDVPATRATAPDAAPGPASEIDRRGPPKGRGKGRRKFSLPPLDDDHEKVSRSIESFLAGGDPTAESGAGGDSGSAGGAATTVALIAIVGGDAGDDAAAAMVERTLRSAARGTDVVEVEDRARFRIVLSGTGELAARAYLRRVRATVEPLLEAADAPLRLVITTATVLDEPAEAAASIAARRLDLALSAVSTDGNGDETAALRAAVD